MFWDDESSALEAIKPYACKADVVKMSDEEAEWLYGIPAQEALKHPLKVTPCTWRMLGLNGGSDIIEALTIACPIQRVYSDVKMATCTARCWISWRLLLEFW